MKRAIIFKNFAVILTSDKQQKAFLKALDKLLNEFDRFCTFQFEIEDC